MLMINVIYFYLNEILNVQLFLWDFKVINNLKLKMILLNWSELMSAERCYGSKSPQYVSRVFWSNTNENNKKHNTKS